MKRNVVTMIMAVSLSVAFTCSSFAAFNSIRRGDKGDNVREIQQILIDQGYLEGSADGAFGGMTEAAVSAYQADHGLDVTGIVGEATYNSMTGNSSEIPSDQPADDSSDAEPSVTTESEASDEQKVHGAPLDTVEIIESDYDLEIIDAGYAISNGYLYYSVIMHNNSTDKAFQYPGMRMMARDASGALIGTGEQVFGTVYPDQDYAWSGLGFAIDEEPAKVEFEMTGIEDYNVKSVTSLDEAEYIPLEPIGVSQRDGTFGPEYIGEIKNPNAYDISGASVNILFRDDNGSLLGGELTFIDTIKAGRTAPFTISPMSRAYTDHYEVYSNVWF